MTAPNLATVPVAIATDGLPPVCEFADMAAVLRWNDPADAGCEGLGAWLLIGADAPSPLCDKHAGIIRDRLPPEHLARLDVRLVRS